MNDGEIRDLFKQHNVPLSRDDIWKVQSTNVIKHSALERLSAALKLVWDMPTIVRSERDECVVLARAHRQDNVSEWSFGEALIVKGDQPGNYKVSGKQASYVYAMAEKRAKDRVIIKLAGLHGAYSEEEAEDFNQRNADTASSGGARSRQQPEPEPEVEDDRDQVQGSAQQPQGGSEDDRPDDRGSVDEKPAQDKPANDDEGPAATALRSAIAKSRTIKAVTDLMTSEDTQKVLNSLQDDVRNDLREAGKKRLIALGWTGTKNKAA